MKIKIVLLGDMSVGKTSFITRYITGKFKDDNSSTLGASFFTQNIKIDGEEHLLEIWDTAGQERYRSLAPMYYRGADVALIFFDLSKLHTYYSIDYWKKELLMTGRPDLIQIVVGNKLDLIDHDKLDSIYKKHFLISTKENIDLDRLINISIREVVRVKNEKEEIINDNLLMSKKLETRKKKSCC
jgi:small GTP-binding protein